jgi:metal-responsive CopG/Arc/MetJ family transcriptional regulator
MDRAVRDGKARNRNELIAAAVRRELAAHQRAATDAAFAQMAHDPDYQTEAHEVATEFAPADWEAWRLGESER